MAPFLALAHSGCLVLSRELARCPGWVLSRLMARCRNLVLSHGLARLRNLVLSQRLARLLMMVLLPCGGSLSFFGAIQPYGSLLKLGAL